MDSCYRHLVATRKRAHAERTSLHAVVWTGEIVYEDGAHDKSMGIIQINYPSSGVLDFGIATGNASIAFQGRVTVQSARAGHVSGTFVAKKFSELDIGEFTIESKYGTNTKGSIDVEFKPGLGWVGAVTGADL